MLLGGSSTAVTRSRFSTYEFRCRMSQPASGSAANYDLVPVQLAGYVLVVEPVADRTPMRARSWVAARQPLLYQRLHLLVRELVAQLYRRVARYGGQDPLLPAHPGCRTLHGGDRIPKSSCHVTALCQGGDHPIYPEGALAEWLHLEAVDRELLEGVGCLSGILGRELDHFGDEQRLYGGQLLVLGVGEPVEQGTLVRYVLIDDPRR